MTDTSPETSIETTAEALERARLPEAGVVRTDCADGDCTENQPLPEAVTRKAQEQKSSAEWAYERLMLYLQNFEKALDSEHEVAMGFAGSEAGTLHIKGIGFFAPDIIAFYGLGQDGKSRQLIQHVSQLNVMLKAAPKIAEKPVRIGFRLGREAEDGNGDAEPAPPADA